MRSEARQMAPEITENNEVNWSDVKILSIETHDTQVDGRVKLTAEQAKIKVEKLMKVLEILTNQEFGLEDSALLNFFLGYLKDHKDLAYKDLPNEENPALNLRDSLLVTLPEAKNRVESMAASRGEYWKMRINATTEEMSSVSDYLESSKDKIIISFSDSHRITGSVFRAMDRNRWIENKNGKTGIAILSFDHHSDTRGRSYDFAKDDVMGSLLHHNYIDELAVVGLNRYSTEPDMAEEHRIQFVYGDELRSSRGPDLEEYICRLEEILKKWKKKNIRTIYPSVDLDSLRLPEVGYTGMDYSLSRELRSFLNSVPDSGLDEVLSDENLDMAASGLTHLIQTRGGAFLDPYDGIPASWIPKALEKAREFGFEIGIRNKKTGQVVAGDVVERHSYDYKLRVAKIAGALIRRMVIIADSK